MIQLTTAGPPDGDEPGNETTIEQAGEDRGGWPDQ